MRSCTVDPYLFENFLTNDGDNLSARFKAFKFPESNFVLFRGTVNVCLDRCTGVVCANGQVGYGRRKRSAPVGQADRNKVYEVSMATVVKVAYEEVDEKPRVWGVEKATLRSVDNSPDEAAIEALSEAFGAYKYVDFQEGNSASTSANLSLLAVLTASLLYLALSH